MQASKEILHSKAGDLRQYGFSFVASANSLSFGSWGNGLDAYAAIQQFGGQADL